MTKRKEFFYTRKFLNRPGYHQLASVLARVTREDTLFIVSDCGKQISLDFDSFDKGSYENSMQKIDILTDTLIKFKEALSKEYATRRDF